MNFMVKLGPKMFGKDRQTSRLNFEHFQTSHFGPKQNFKPHEQVASSVESVEMVKSGSQYIKKAT